MHKSIAVLLLAAIFAMVSTSAMAQLLAQSTWQVTAINDTVPAGGIDLTLSGPISGPIAVNPFPATFTAPPPSTELDATWSISLLPGQAFIADFNLPTGLTPSLAFGNWTLGGAGPTGVIPAIPIEQLFFCKSGVVLLGMG
jgi:hypothetical protein